MDIENYIKLLRKICRENDILICFDEMQITDIADAMLVGRLFEKIVNMQISFICTSNRKPGDLYKDGLNRELFLPFIDLLESNLKIFPLNADRDYRRDLLKGSEKYFQQMSEWIDVALEEGIRFFVTSLGKPDWVCDKVHAKGGVVYHDVTSRKWAEKGKECGVDGLICVNNRAGGHLGELTMEEMYEQLSDMGLPLICAGGIGSELELADALNIGYDGVQMGTRFIATDECTTPEDYKNAILGTGFEVIKVVSVDKIINDAEEARKLVD